MNNQTSNSSIKDPQENWKYILIVLILAIIVGGGILCCQYWWAPKQEISFTKYPEIKKEEKEILSAQQIISSDKEVLEILKEFAEKKSYIEKPEIGYNEILLDVLEFKDENIKERLEKVESGLEKWGEVLEDAPDMRSFTRANTKTCIAKSIINNDFEHVCNIKEDFAVSRTYVDDILAVDEILPYFLAGFAYYKEGDYSKADYYFKQVKIHRQVGIKQWGEPYFIEVAGPIYEKIYNKTMKLSPEEVILGE